MGYLLPIVQYYTVCFARLYVYLGVIPPSRHCVMVTLTLSHPDI